MGKSPRSPGRDKGRTMGVTNGCSVAAVVERSTVGGDDPKIVVAVLITI
jgi:hypothetical protein